MGNGDRGHFLHLLRLAVQEHWLTIIHFRARP